MMNQVDGELGVNICEVIFDEPNLIVCLETLFNVTLFTANEAKLSPKQFNEYLTCVSEIYTMLKGYDNG